MLWLNFIDALITIEESKETIIVKRPNKVMGPATGQVGHKFMVRSLQGLQPYAEEDKYTRWTSLRGRRMGQIVQCLVGEYSMPVAINHGSLTAWSVVYHAAPVWVGDAGW